MAAPSFVNTIFGIAKMLGAKSGWTKDERLGIIDDLKVRAEQMVSVTALTEAGNERGSRKSEETHVAPRARACPSQPLAFSRCGKGSDCI